MGTFSSDLRNAWRQLLRRPLLSGSAILVLGLGVGACATAFSLVNAVYFKALGFSDPDQLVQVYEESPSQLCPGCVGQVSFATFEDVMRNAAGVTGVAAFQQTDLAVEAGTNAEVRRGAVVSANLFELIGIRMLRGTGFDPKAGNGQGTPGVVLGEGLAQSRFGSADAALGEPLRVNGIEHRVVGVMPAGMRFPELADLWVPLAVHRNADADARELQVVARLAPGTMPDGYSAQMISLGESLAVEHPERFAEWRIGTRPFRSHFSDGAGEFFKVLLAAAAIVLIVTCVNLAGLVLARGAEREAELGMRSALGASRSRLLRQLMIENLMLALFGGIVASLVTVLGVRLVRMAMPAEIPFYFDFSPDLRVVGFSLALALLTTFAFGLLPALRASRVQLRGSLVDAGRGMAAVTRAPARRALIGMEIGLTVLLLGVATVLMTSLLGKTSSRLNYPIADLQETSLQLLGVSFATPEARDQALTRVRESLARSGLPAAISGWQRLAPDPGWSLPGAPPRAAVPVSPEYFEVLGLPMRGGRSFAETDLQDGEPIVVLGESMASALWPQQSAVGQTLPLALGSEGVVMHQVVGVVADGRRELVGEARPREIYLPLRNVGQELSLKLRARSGSETEPLLREAIRRASPELAVESLRALSEGGSGRWQLRSFFRWCWAALRQ